MMSDHWKAIARMLGAPGAADPLNLKPEAAKAGSPDKVIPNEEPRTASSPLNEDEDFGQVESKSESRELELAGDDVLNFKSFHALEDEPKQFSSEPTSNFGFETPPPPPGPDEPRGLDRILGAPEPTNEPSSWDLLVDRLGVVSEKPQSADQPTPQERQQASTPSDIGAKSDLKELPKVREEKVEKRKPRRSSGFGFGLIDDFEDEAANEVVPVDSQLDDQPVADDEPLGGRAFGASQSVEEDLNKFESTSEAAANPNPADEPDFDPLSTLGEFGWGPPRRNRAKGRGDSKPTEQVVPPKPEDRDVSFQRPSQGRAPTIVPESAETGASRSRGADRTESRTEGRRSGSETGRAETGRTETGRGDGRRDRERYNERDDQGNRDRESGGRQVSDRSGGSRSATGSGADEPRAGKDAAPRSAKRGFKEVDQPETRGGRRGQRSTPRSNLDDDIIDFDGDDVDFPATPRGFAEDLFDDDDFLEVEDTTDVDDSLVSDIDSDERENGVKRRRRRGRRRRGGEAESAEPTSERSGVTRSVEPSTGNTGRAIDAEFDDDHEDDEEVVALRRSRKRRKRRGVEIEEAAASVDHADTDSVEEVAYEPADPIDDLDEDVSNFQIQRNVPTWLDAVEILVNSNIESRRKDTKRPSGGQAGSGPNGGGGGRPRSRR